MADNNEAPPVYNNPNPAQNENNEMNMMQMFNAMMTQSQNFMANLHQQQVAVTERLTRRMEREHDKMPAITTEPKPFDTYVHYTCENYLNTEIKRWLEASGIPSVHAPKMLARGWPKQKDAVDAIVEAARIAGNRRNFDMERIYRRVNDEIIHLNPSVLQSILARLEHKPREKYSLLLDNIKKITNVVYADMDADQRFNTCKNKFKEIIELEFESQYWRNKKSRDQLMAIVKSRNYAAMNEMDLKQEIWYIEKFYPHEFDGPVQTPLQLKKPDDDMDVSAIGSFRRANKNTKGKKLGTSWRKYTGKNSVACPNSKCPATYLKTWCQPIRKAEDGGYKFCGVCATQLKVSPVNNVEESDNEECNEVEEAKDEGRPRGMSNGIGIKARVKRSCPTRNSSFSAEEGLGEQSIIEARTVEKSSNTLEEDSMTEFLRQASKQKTRKPDPCMDFGRGAPNEDNSWTFRQSLDVEKTSEDAQNCFDQEIKRDKTKRKSTEFEGCNKTSSSEVGCNTVQPRKINITVKVGTNKKAYSGQIDTGAGSSFIHPETYSYLREHQPEFVSELDSDCGISFKAANGTPMNAHGVTTIQTRLFDSVNDSKNQTIKFIVPAVLNCAFLLGRKDIALMGDAYIDVKNSKFLFNNANATSEMVNVVEQILNEHHGSSEGEDLLDDGAKINTFEAPLEENNTITIELKNKRSLRVCADRSKEFQNGIKKCFDEYSDVLLDESKIEIGSNNTYTAKISNCRKPKTCFKYASSPPLMRDITAQKIEKLIQQGVVEYTNMAANCQTFTVEKHNSFKKDDPRHYRIVNDLREYNKTVNPHVFHNRTAKDMLSEFCKSKIFSTTDACDAYHTVPYTADFPVVSTIPGSSKNILWKRLPQGLTNAGAFYAESMETCFPRSEFPECIRYADDSLVHTDEEEKHLQVWERLLQRYRDSGLKIDLSSTWIGYPEVDFLNFRVSNNQYAIGKKHRDTINQLSNWKKTTENVVGFVQYLSDFLKDNQYLLHKLRRNEADGWTEENKNLVEELQSILLSADYLYVPDHQMPIHIFTDAGNEGFASGLFVSELNKPFDKMKKGEREKMKLCAFYSKDCTDQERWQRRSTYEQELYGLVDAKARYEFYITGSHPVYIYTDNKSVSESSRSRSPKIRALFDELKQHENVKIVLIDTKINMADIFTRNMDLSECVNSVKTRRQARALENQLSKDEVLKAALAFHKEGGHPSAERMRIFLEERYGKDRPGLVPTRAECEKLLEDCICQKRKIDHGRESYQIPTPTSPNHTIYIDYKNLNGMKILSILESLSGGYFPIPVKNEEASHLIETLTKFMMIYGRVKTIVADNGNTFTGKEMNKFCRDLGINLKFVNIYSPQANKAERPHSSLNKALQLAKESKESKSGKTFGHTDLLMFSWTQNSIPKSRTNHSPFEIMKGAFCDGLYDGTDDLPDDLKPKYTNNEYAEEAINKGLNLAFDKFTDKKQPEMLEAGTKVRWIMKRGTSNFEREAVVLYDNISSVLVQFNCSDTPKWVRKADLTLIV